MDPQLGNYTLTADNKGILSLLSAIEQSGDNYDAETSPSKIMDKESLAAAENFSQLQTQLSMETVNNLEGLEMSGDINLANFSPCIVCGRNPSLENPSESMLDIFSELSLPGEEKFTSVYSLLDEMITLELDTSRTTSLVCVDCVSMVEMVLKLKAQIAEYTNLIRSRHDEWSKKKSKFPSVSDYTSVLDLKMPLNIFNVKEEEGSAVNILSKESNRKSKLDILAETLEGEHRVRQDSQDLDQHISINKENEVRKAESVCDKCGKQFRTGPVKKNSRTSRTSCNFCIKEARSRPLVVQKIWTCTQCEKTFKSKNSMNEHFQQKHLGNVKSYSCSECSETFTSKHSKAVHERLHKGSKGLQCDECGDSFQTIQSLHHHRSKHTGEFSYHCESCGKGFNNFKLLEEHSHIHTGDKPYSCQECNKSFGNRGSLWLHRKKHLNKKPYVCDYCNKEFGHSSHLVVHKRMHTGETPYKCRFCDEGFISGNHLKRHMRSHQNELPFACGLCKQEFSKRSDLVKHGNSLHSGKVVDDVKMIDTSQLEEPSGPNQDETSTVEQEGGVEELREGEYTRILVDHQDRMLLNKLGGDGETEYVIPVSLLEAEEEVKQRAERGDQEGTIVYIQIPSNHFMPEEGID